jgi:hypothetical protein
MGNSSTSWEFAAPSAFWFTTALSQSSFAILAFSFKSQFLRKLAAPVRDLSHPQVWFIYGAALCLVLKVMSS